LQQGYFNIFGGAMICVPLSNNKRVTLLWSSLWFFYFFFYF
jgi:hypothetical protein